MATRGQQKTKAELTRLEKEAEKRSAERQAANKERSKAEMERRTGSNARLSKKELTKKELEAERKSRVKPGEGRGLKEFLKRESEARSKKAPKPGTRRAKVQARRVAEKNIPKAVRDLMVSEKQDAQNKGDSKLRTQNRRGPSKTSVEQSIKSATDKAKSTVKSAASRVGPLAKIGAGLSSLLYSADAGKDSDIVPSKQTAKGKKEVPARGMSTPQPAGAKGRGDGKAEVKQRKEDATKSTPKSTKSDAPAGPPRSIAEAKKRGLDYFVGKDGKRKAAVTAEELKASGLSLRDYLNKKQGKTRKMSTGGYANCGASMRPTQKSSQGNR